MCSSPFHGWFWLRKSERGEKPPSKRINRKGSLLVLFGEKNKEKDTQKRENQKSDKKKMVIALFSENEKRGRGEEMTEKRKASFLVCCSCCCCMHLTLHGLLIVHGLLHHLHLWLLLHHDDSGYWNDCWALCSTNLQFAPFLRQSTTRTTKPYKAIPQTATTVPLRDT